MTVSAKFWAITEDDIAKLTEGAPDYDVFLISDNDLLPLGNFKTWQKVGEYNDVIFVKAVLSMGNQEAMEGFGDVESVHSIEAVTALDIAGKYMGLEYSWEPYAGLFWFIQHKYGVDLSGEYDSGNDDEDGNPVIIPYIKRVFFAGE